MINKTHLTSLLVIASLSLGGCASAIKAIHKDNPLMLDHLRDVSKSEITDDTEVLRLSFIGKELAGREDQRLITSRFSDTEFVRSISAADIGTASSALTDLAVGRLGSGLGTVVGSGVFIGAAAFNLFSSDGALERIDKAALPTNPEPGITLDSEVNATSYLHKKIESDVSTLASENDMMLVCLRNCGENDAAYKLTPSLDTLQKYTYRPDDIYVHVYSKEGLKAVKPSVVLNAAYGFPVAYKSDSFIIRIWNKPSLTETGEINPLKLEKEAHPMFGMTAPKSATFTSLTQIGDDIMSGLHNSPYLVHGMDYSGKRRVWYNGKVYTFFSVDTEGRFIDELITSPSLLN